MKSIEKKKSNAIWRFFSSVKLTIVLLILLAVASVIGTLIPQLSQREGIEFARSLSPEVFRFLNSLDLFDMYHSLWFRFLIGCLAMNLVICSIDRFPIIWKLSHKTPSPDRSKPFEALSPEQTFLVAGKIGDASDQVGKYLNRHFKKIHTKETSGCYFFYTEKGRFSRFGVYMVHSSVLLILIGALVGSFFAFEAFVNIAEGEQVDSIHLRQGKGHIALGFEVRCDKFTVDFYENGAPNEYRSDLTFVVDGKEVEKRSIRVNHPVQFMGITFYQSTYGTIPGKKIRLKIYRKGDPKKPATLETEQGETLQIPGSEDRFSVVDVKGDFMDTGPAVLIAAQAKDGEEKHLWVFRDYEKIRKRLPAPMLQSPKFDPSAFKPYTFFLDGLETGYYTGLQVNRDPGVLLVWAGCFLIIAGFFVTFFTSHVRIWIRLSGESQKIAISVAGTSNRNPVGLERQLSRLRNDIRKRFSGKDHSHA